MRASPLLLVAVVLATSCSQLGSLGSQFDRSTAQQLLDREVRGLQSAAHASDQAKEFASKWHSTPEVGAFDPTEVIRPPVQVTGVANGPGVGLGAVLAPGAEKLATFTVSTVVSPETKRPFRIGGVAYFKKYDDGWRIELILANSVRDTL